MTITEFLNARLDEDEARSHSGWSREPEERWENTNEGQSVMTPRAMLADIVAKRIVLELHAPTEDRNWKSGASHGYLWCSSCGSLDDSPEPYPCRTTRALAQPHGGHPDYREEWKP